MTSFTRIFDLLFSFFGLILLFPLFILVYVLCFIDTKSPLFIQERLGKQKKIFRLIEYEVALKIAEARLIKFRTMSVGTDSVPTHLAKKHSVTRLGEILRRTKLDELPQLLNVLKGDMSLVGPRPGLPNHIELTNARENHDIYLVRPGITGLAQINKVDMSSPVELAILDKKMIKNFSNIKYFKYIVLTLLGLGMGDRTRR